MAILFGSVEMVVALHVSRTVAVMLSVRVFSELQASYHCSSVIWLYCNSSMSSYIWFELLSKNFICESSIFSFGMGLSILGGGLGVMIGVLAVNIFGRIFSCMGK